LNFNSSVRIKEEPSESEARKRKLSDAGSVAEPSMENVSASPQQKEKKKKKKDRDMVEEKNGHEAAETELAEVFLFQSCSIVNV